jgi:hypothetical protein
VEANGRESLENIFRNAGMDKEIWPQFAVINGMESGQTPKKGQLIKILR